MVAKIEISHHRSVKGYKKEGKVRYNTRSEARGRTERSPQKELKDRMRRLLKSERIPSWMRMDEEKNTITQQPAWSKVKVMNLAK